MCTSTNCGDTLCYPHNTSTYALHKPKRNENQIKNKPTFDTKCRVFSCLFLCFHPIPITIQNASYVSPLIVCIFFLFFDSESSHSHLCMYGRWKIESLIRNFNQLLGFRYEVKHCIHSLFFICVVVVRHILKRNNTHFTYQTIQTSRLICTLYFAVLLRIARPKWAFRV